MTPTGLQLEPQHQMALQRERLAWFALNNSALPSTSPQRAELLAAWCEALHELCETSTTLSAVSAQHCHRELVACAETLTATSTLRALPLGHGHAIADVCLADPLPGGSYQRRDGSLWRVSGLVTDELEPQLYLVQLVRVDAGGRGEADEVYCEDWRLYAVLHGLRRID